MSLKPERVQLLEQGVVKLELMDSDRGSLNGRQGPNGRYNGRATSARISGKAGSGVTFYDDQQFRTGENSVYIEKKTDEVIEVFLARNFVNTEEKAGTGIFAGEDAEFKWVLFKSPKKDILDKIVGAIGQVVDWEKLVAQMKASGNPEIMVAGTVLGITDGSNASNNYRVDNCSSVQFAGV
jgi:hypothetical protein